MNWQTCKGLIRSDYQRLKSRKSGGVKSSFLACYFLDDTFPLIVWFRIGSYLQSCRNPIARILYVFVWFVYRHKEHKLSIQLPLGTHIGGGLRFPHYGSIVIAQSSIIGENATIHNDVTIGRSFGESSEGCPKLGDSVVVFAGAKLVGNIEIGNNVVIGANSVVNKSFPDKSVVAGTPGKIISTDSSRCFNEYWSKAFCQK